MGEEKIIPLYSLEFLDDSPIIKDRWTRKKKKRKLLWISHMHTGDTEVDEQHSGCLRFRPTCHPHRDRSWWRHLRGVSSVRDMAGPLAEEMGR